MATCNNCDAMMDRALKAENERDELKLFIQETFHAMDPMKDDFKAVIEANKIVRHNFRMLYYRSRSDSPLIRSLFPRREEEEEEEIDADAGEEGSPSSMEEGELETTQVEENGGEENGATEPSLQSSTMLQSSKLQSSTMLQEEEQQPSTSQINNVVEEQANDKPPKRKRLSQRQRKLFKKAKEAAQIEATQNDG
uniref:Uncharacterized protein n=1 Tax=Meloidogyne javanica TaxID=6303 RepID=A0A915NE89_MELJA